MNKRRRNTGRKRGVGIERESSERWNGRKKEGKKIFREKVKAVMRECEKEKRKKGRKEKKYSERK